MAPSAPVAKIMPSQPVGRPMSRETKIITLVPANAMLKASKLSTPASARSTGRAATARKPSPLSCSSRRQAPGNANGSLVRAGGATSRTPRKHKAEAK